MTIISPVGNQFINRNLLFSDIKQDKEAHNFTDNLRQALGRVNMLQVEASEATTQLVEGDLQNLHQVMIKMEEAQLALQLTVQTVNKVIHAYQEIARMQI